MSQILSQMFKLAYRKEPISNFVLIVGAVDAVMGGVGSHGTLLLLGLGLVSMAIALRWQSIQRRQAFISLEEPEPPLRYLPPAPTLDLSQQQDRK